MFAASHAAAQSQLYLTAPAGIANDWKQSTITVLNEQNDTVSKGSVRLRLRGSSSRQFPKHSYTLRSEQSIALIDSSKPLKSWVLYALYYDGSYIRAALAFQLARATGRYAPAAQFCELYLNGKYEGLYAITEYISRESTSRDDFIFKIDKDKDFRRHGWPSVYDTNVRFFFQDPKKGAISISDKEGLIKQVASFEAALSGNHFRDNTLGWRRYLDEDAAVDYFLTEELTRPVDAYRSSSHFHWQDGGKIVPGPVWDFDQSMGNSERYGADSISGWQYEASARCGKCLPKVPFWWRRLQEDSVFMQHVRGRWKSLRSATFSNKAIIHAIDSLMPPAAAVRHDRHRWPPAKRSLPANARNDAGYRQEIIFLKDWLRRRTAWLDTML